MTIDYDVETTGLQPYSGTQHAFLYSFSDGKESVALPYSPEDTHNRAEIQRWFDRAAVEGIRAHNAKFDWAFGEQAGFTMPPADKWHDSMIVAQAINERRSVALKAVAQDLFGEDAADLQKQVKGWLTEERRRRKKSAEEAGEELVEPNFSDVPMEIMEPYALEDVILTRKVSEQYDPLIEQTPDLKKVVEFERETLGALYDVEKRGLPATRANYHRLELEVNENLDVLEDRCQKLAAAGGAKEFNPRSSQQVIQALKGRGADLSYMSEKNGKLSADAENLRAVHDELAEAILEFRSEAKVLSTYVQPMLGRHHDSSLRVWKEPFIGPDDRIHANYRQVGARTGRMCIAAGTMIDGPRDLLVRPLGIPIEKVRAGDYVYSHSDALVPQPKKVLDTFRQGKRKVLKLIWRAAGNKSYLGELKATPEHKIRLRDGSYKRLDTLRPGDQLSFLSRQVTGDGYAKVCWQHGSGDGVASAVDEHRHIGPSSPVVHHINENKLDNSLGNLQGLTISEHSKLHNPVGIFRPERNKPCPYSISDLREFAAEGILWCIQNLPHDYRTMKRWFTEACIELPDRRTTNHVVVAVIDEGEFAETYDLEVEDTPCFVANEIAVHNSCSDPNIQNQPRDDLRLRYCIAAEPGHKLVAVDLSNVEMMFFAAYAGEGRLLDAVKKGEDLHVLTAKMLGIRDRARPGGAIESARQLGKTYNFSRVYGGGLRTIKRQFRCSMDEARLLRKRFDDAYPEVQRLTNRIEYKLHDQGYISDKLISGRRFRVDPRDAYKGTNYLVQGTAAALLKWALIQLWKDGVPIVALVHDEILAHPKISDAEEVKQLIIQRMTEHPGLEGVVPLRADGAIIDHWSDAKPLKDGSLFVPEWAKEAA